MNNNRHLARLYNYRKEEAKSIERAKKLRNEKITKEKENINVEYKIDKS